MMLRLRLLAHTERTKVMRKEVVTYLAALTLSVPLFAFITSPGKADHDYVKIVVFIESGDFFSGKKVEHQVYWKQGRSRVKTGTTNIWKWKLQSVGDDFSFQTESGNLVVQGKTASGLAGVLTWWCRWEVEACKKLKEKFIIGPFINYEFTFSGGRNSARGVGSHDGYPSYQIFENGVRIYYHKHKPNDVGLLFGRGDIKVNLNYKYPRLPH